MKLKKIASLALAGLMAVSMLAGCGDNSSSNGNGDATVETGSNTSAVATFNDTQSEFNDVKVTFSSSASLDSALDKAVKAEPTGNVTDIGALIRKITGITYEASSNIKNALNNNDVKKGDSDTYVTVLKYEKAKTGCLSEDAAVKAAAVAADGEIAELKEDDGTTAGKDTYVAYEYTGSVSVVTSETSYGDVNYYVAIVVTKTGVEKTLTEKDA